MSNDILLTKLGDSVLVNVGSEKEELSLTGTSRTKPQSNTNGNANSLNISPMNSSEAAKLLDVTHSESESDLNLQFTLPKRKVRFKRKLRPSTKGKGKRQPDDNVSTPPCLCRCTESLGILAFLALTSCIGILMWFHYNLSSKVDHIQKQSNAIEAQYKETPEALHDYHVQLRFLESNVSLFGDELKKINAEIGTIKKDVEKLKQTSTEIKASIAAAPEIKTLPKDVESLSESVASIGSKITALESLAKDLKEQQSTFAATAESITKQQEIFKENIQGILNVTSQPSSYTRQDSEAAPTLASSLSSQQMSQVTDAIAQLNSTFAPKMTEVGQLHKYVDSINKSVATLEGKFHHAHELMHTLQHYVNDNLTQRISYLEEHDYNADPIHEKLMQQVLGNKLSEALNHWNSNSSSSNESDSWMSLLGDANQMVGLYMQLYKKLSPEVKFPLDGTEAAGQLLNATLSGLFKEHKGDIQKLQEDLHSLSNSCESAVNLLSRNITQVSQRVNQLASMNDDMQHPVKLPPFFPNRNSQEGNMGSTQKPVKFAPFFTNSNGQEGNVGSTLPSLQPDSNQMTSTIVPPAN